MQGTRIRIMIREVDWYKVFETSKEASFTCPDERKTCTHAIGWGGLPPLQVVCNLTSFREVGGPVEVYVGVSEGSQKSGSLFFNDSACSRSISRRAASSASRARFSTVEESKANLRFVPLAYEILINTRVN